MNDDKLDKIFQEAAHGIDFGSSSAGWNDMKSRLEAVGVAPKTTNGSPLRWLWLLLPLLLVITAGIIWMSNGGSVSNASESNLLVEKETLSTGEGVEITNAAESSTSDAENQESNTLSTEQDTPEQDTPDQSSEGALQGAEGDSKQSTAFR